MAISSSGSKGFVKYEQRHVAQRGSLFTPEQREGLRSLLAERDELITLLARSDPAAGDRLLTVYSNYNRVTNNAG